MTLSGHVYLATSGLWQFVRISLFFMTFIILRVYSQVFYKMFLKLDSSDIFLTVWLELWGSWEEDQRCETPFSTYQFKGIFLTRRSSLMLCTDHLAEILFARFLYYKVIFFLPRLSILCALARLGSWMLPAWWKCIYWNYLEFFGLDFLHIPHLDIYTIILPWF